MADSCGEGSWAHLREGVGAGPLLIDFSPFSNNLGEAIAKEIPYSCSLGLCLTPASLSWRSQGYSPAAQPLLQKGTLRWCPAAAPGGVRRLLMLGCLWTEERLDRCRTPSEVMSQPGVQESLHPESIRQLSTLSKSDALPPVPLTSFPSSVLLPLVIMIYIPTLLCQAL